METSLFNRVQATLLALATAALFAAGGLQFPAGAPVPQPDDGVWWREAQAALDQPTESCPISPASAPASRPTTCSRGSAIADTPTLRRHVVADLERALYAAGAYGQVDYTITRDGIPLETPVKVIPEPPDRSLQLGLRIIGLIYLVIGFYVLFRRWGAPARHALLSLLPGFVRALRAQVHRQASTLWTGPSSGPTSLAEALQPALFLHFALSFPEERFKNLRRRWLLPLVYAPGAGLLGLWLLVDSTRARPPSCCSTGSNQIGTAYDAVFYVLAALLFLRSYSRANTPLLRQQLKWVTRGTLLAVLPFTLFYAIPYPASTCNPPHLLTKLAGLSLVFLPLTFSWAIVRYRLMDTDLIFKRGVAYTLATALIVGGYFGVIALIAVMVHNAHAGGGARVGPGARHSGHGRRLRSPQAPHSGLGRSRLRPPSLRLPQGAGRVRPRPELGDRSRRLCSTPSSSSCRARCWWRAWPSSSPSEAGQPAPGRFARLARRGQPRTPERRARSSRLSRLRPGRRPLAHLLENAQQALHLPPSSSAPPPARPELLSALPRRRTASEPRRRTIAVIGLGRTLGGDFLSSEDVELLESLASYIGIALQNASLYARLEEKIGEFERLKEFNENIVESINVGIFAIDLDDRIESWNAQMEAMYALSRAEASARSFVPSFPSEFIEALEGFRNEQGVHHLYKFRLTTRAGEQRTANIAIAPLLSRDFVPVGRIILVDDITERVSLETQLAQADKLSSIGLLAAGVAHEINTPLAVISSYAQMLSKQTARRCAPRAGARQDHAAELPRRRNRQRPAEFLAHFHHRVPRHRSQPGDSRHAFAARTPVQDRADSSSISTWPTSCRPSTAIPANCSRSSSTCC